MKLTRRFLGGPAAGWKFRCCYLLFVKKGNEEFTLIPPRNSLGEAGRDEIVSRQLNNVNWPPIIHFHFQGLTPPLPAPLGPLGQNNVPSATNYVFGPVQPLFGISIFRLLKLLFFDKVYNNV